MERERARGRGERGKKEDKRAVVKAEREAWEKERSGLVEKNNKKRKIVVGVFFKRKNKNNKKY
jgi:hypothetical protein